MTLDDYSPAKLELHSYEFSLRGLPVPMLLILSGYQHQDEDKSLGQP